MRIYLVIFLSFLVHVVFSQESKVVSSKEASNMIMLDSNMIVIDCRDSVSFVQGHLPRAYNIDAYDLLVQEKIALFDKKKTYLVYCRTHNRSNVVCAIMTKQGFENIYQLYEGFLVWQELNFDVVK